MATRRRFNALAVITDSKGRSLGVWAFSNRLMPGLSLAVRYGAEPGLMMERILLWRAADPPMV